MADISTTRRLGKARRHFRIRKKVSGTAGRPRLVVTRSSRHITAQVIDDITGRTLAAASTVEGDLRSGPTGNKDAAATVGRLVAERAKAVGVDKVVFDRGGHLYPGRVAAGPPPKRSRSPRPNSSPPPSKVTELKNLPTLCSIRRSAPLRN